MSVEIHATAIVSGSAEIADGTLVGPYTIIEGGVKIGPDNEIGPFCRFGAGTTIGAGNRFESHCSVGPAPQDLKFSGEPTVNCRGSDQWLQRPEVSCIFTRTR